MSGVNYRGRARLRDQQATERLSALLEGVAERADGPVDAALDAEGFESARDPAVEVGGPQHREPVAVRAFFARPAVVVLIAVLLVVCGVSALSLLPGGSDPEASVVAEADASGSPEDSGQASGAGSPASPPGPAPSPGAPHSATPAGAPSSALTVHVVGEVKKPAVVQLSPGARVIDAVEAAGGLTDAAITERINLAQPVTDGQQVLIPNKQTAADVQAPGQPAGSAPGPPAGDDPAKTSGSEGAGKVPDGGAGKSGAASGEMINLNTATAADLEELPRVGPVLAQRIIDFRTEQGPFTAPEQLDDVSGIGPAMLDALLPLVTV